MASVTHIDGITDLRRSLRVMGDRGTLALVQGVTRGAAEIVARDARTLVANRSGRGTGKLAGSIRGTTSGSSGIVRSPLPYAGVQEYGGTIRPKGSPVEIRPQAFVSRAADRNQEKVARALSEGFDALARANGWR
jgi:phage gpG-like protein